MESRKKILMSQFAGRQSRHRHREQTPGPWGREERAGRMETYTTLHVNQMGDSENSNQGFVTTEGWDGVGGERELQAGGDVCMGLPWWLSAKETACSAEDAGDLGSIAGLG